ncbi:hypothetical protein MPTK1_3g04620 [Marchantia polymorpha subsp. ruderalis]|uniref:Cytochrome b561 and DOMON domain-containing protein n=2 Tax=Marchantia polymorpha TaxID=3197 RepID=A0A176W9U2_MARPO|nr:hypothetical protein AXG93_4831s1000 [Marchantia polymorpha subsp. ruderalis]PTQ43963.1 hypothetical protein MARPO_0022s0067 [Marchantia polymorpha]BBN04439.1 hypothetical protein Mp_3g04620 [Marchantia polymorpha subsp. ruderalis]|eukprot:PTQ43963.1 hypothetical protein MARPO_0022s0067 [Marchantia polymorpha]
MAHSRRLAPVPVLALVAALTLFSWAEVVLAQGCNSTILKSTSGQPKSFQQCLGLPKLGSSLSWNYDPSTFEFDFEFHAVLSSASGWAGWGFNPTGELMTGGSALIAFNGANGTNLLPYKLIGSPTPPSAIDMVVLPNSMNVTIIGLNVTFSAKLQLTKDQTTLNQLWNYGSSVSGYSPGPHSLTGDNAASYGKLDVTTGTVTASEIPNKTLKDNHGIVNALAWGFMFPLGVMAARYMRPFKIFDPLWFYVHVGCQVSAYILGVVGWGMGLKLGTLTSVDHDKHKNLGIALFTLATLQLTALGLRPNLDNKYRKYWNVYHHTIGFTLIILSIINVFEGIEILAPAKGWKTAYVVILITLAVIALILEIGTWSAWYFKKTRIPSDKLGEEGRANGSRPPVYGEDNGNQQWVREPQL